MGDHGGSGQGLHGAVSGKAEGEILEVKLVNAVRARHYGSFLSIENKVEELHTYIAEHSLLPITQPYFIVQDIQNDIFDVYIGISENVL